MTSREIVRRTLDYEGPERVARSFRESDFAGAGVDAKTHATDWREVGGGRWERIDEWGNLWGRVDPFSKGEVIQGVLDDLNDIETFEFPDYADPKSYEPTRKTAAANPDKYIIGSMPGFAFNIARKLRKLEQYLVDILSDAERIHVLHDRVDAILEDMIRNHADAGADAVMFCEDWGTQQQLLIDPALWRTEFGPRYQKLCALAHGLDLNVFMHSCGQTEAIVPDLMASGIDLLQFDQPELHGIDNLAAHQRRGKITFWCPVDIQTTLQSQDAPFIRRRAREMLDKLWQGRGGFVAGYYGDNPSIGLDPKWQEIACDEFSSCGLRERYKA